MKDFLAKIFAVWALIIFGTTIVFVAILMWIIGIIREPQRTKVFRIICKIWMKFFFFVTGCSLKLKGKNNFHPGENYIITCNHNSFMDVLVATPSIPGANKTIAKAELAKIPLFGLVYKRGSVLVDRKDKDSRKNSFIKMKKVLSMRMHMCIYPEGTRNKTDLPLTPFHDGAFKLAVETQTAIMPTLLFNTRKILPAGKQFYFWPSGMEMHFLPPIAVNSEDDVQQLKEKTFRIMTDYYSAHVK